MTAVVFEYYLSSEDFVGFTSLPCETLKAHVRGEIISYTGFEYKLRKEKLAKLTQQISQLDNNLCCLLVPPDSFLSFFFIFHKHFKRKSSFSFNYPVPYPQYIQRIHIHHPLSLSINTHYHSQSSHTAVLAC